MRAALLEEQGKPLQVRGDIEIAEPRAGEVRVRVSHCGVCHSDLSVADGVFPSPVPVVLGHEAAGRVDAVGRDVTLVSPGDPVVLTACPPCGTCYWCVRGEASICVNSSALQTQTLPDGTTGLSRGGDVVYRGVGVGAFVKRHRLVQEFGGTGDHPRAVMRPDAGFISLDNGIQRRRIDITLLSENRLKGPNPELHVRQFGGMGVIMGMIV